MSKLVLLGYAFYVQSPSYCELLEFFDSPAVTRFSLNSYPEADLTIRLIFIQHKPTNYGAAK